MKVKIYTLIGDCSNYDFETYLMKRHWEIGESGDVEYWRKKFTDLLKSNTDEENKKAIKELKKLPEKETMLYISKLWGLAFGISEKRRDKK